MEKIHIFADSTSDIPRPLCEKYGIEIVPIQLHCGGRSFREYYDITPEEYWKLIEESDEIPATAQATPEMFLSVYHAARKNGYTHVLGVLMNSKGSGTYQSACVAREMFYEEAGREMRIELFDSESYTYIYGRIVVQAAEMRASGESFEAIAALVCSRIRRAEAVLGVYSLKHLRKSGRISGAAAFAGEALGLRPICTIRAHSVDVIGKVRGDRRLPGGVIEQVKRRAEAPARQTADLLYADVPAEVLDDIERMLLEECGFAAVQRWPIGPAVVTNTGPRAFAVAYYGAPRQG